MPTPTLVTTPGASTANAYCSIAEADAYHDGHVGGSVWAALTTDAKTRAIMQATRMLDAYVVWDGYATKVADGQVLAFPRAGLVDLNTDLEVDDETIPTNVKYACAEQARLLAQSDRSLELAQQAQGLSMLSAGGVVLTFQQNAPGREAIAPSVWALVRQWGRRLPSARTSHAAQLERV